MYSTIDTMWILVSAALVFFMQAGFTMVESGLTRAKNSGNIIMKNLLDFALGTIAFWVLGFGLMFGKDLFGVIGFPDPFISGDYSGTFPSYAFLIFQTVFCATSATIVSGAMAERTKFSSYCLYSLLISMFVYPVSGHWIWGGGWLSKLGFHDFAGSTAVHMVGGISALVGAIILGPRIGKYDKNGKTKAIPGHNLTMVALGVFILWFCWFGFNGGSTLGMEGELAYTASKIFYNTNIAAAISTVTALCITWLRYKKPDVSMTLNGSLAGLVAVTAGCDIVNPIGAAVIGLIAGFAIVFGIEFIDKKLKIDDPVGAIGVHGINGAIGTILTGVFAKEGGLLYGGGFKLIGIQTLGVLTVAAWVVVTMTIIFKIIKKTIGLRVTEQEEIEGLDIHEHGLSSCYADFMSMPQTGIQNIYPITDITDIKDIPKYEYKGTDKLTKIEIVTKQSKFEALKAAMNEIGVTGMTVTNVLGCGVQKGCPEYYRGVPVDITLLPKIVIEIVVCKVPVRTVIETAKKVLYTGHIGDGKIFVYDVENAIKVRTGEEGSDALQARPDEDFF